MTDQLAIENVLDAPDLRIWQHRGSSDRLVVCFSGIGTDPETAPGYEFAATAAGGGKDWVLYIADPQRTWLNGPDLLERIVEQVEDLATRIGARRVCTLGHSMGGFAASVLPGFTRVDVALALSPQASVHPEIAGDDPRWAEYRERIGAFRIRQVADHIDASTRYFVVFGMHKRERPQRARFPRAENVTWLRMPGVAHATASRLKARGLLDPLVQAAFDGRVRKTRRMVERHFGVPGRGVKQEVTNG